MRKSLAPGRKGGGGGPQIPLVKGKGVDQRILGSLFCPIQTKDLLFEWKRKSFSPKCMCQTYPQGWTDIPHRLGDYLVPFGEWGLWPSREGTWQILFFHHMRLQPLKVHTFLKSQAVKYIDIRNGPKGTKIGAKMSNLTWNRGGTHGTTRVRPTALALSRFYPV